MGSSLEEPLSKGGRKPEASLGFWVAGISHSERKPVGFRLLTSFRRQVPDSGVKGWRAGVDAEHAEHEGHSSAVPRVPMIELSLTTGSHRAESDPRSQGLSGCLPML